MVHYDIWAIYCSFIKCVVIVIHKVAYTIHLPCIRVSVFVGQLSLLRRLDHQPRVDRIGCALPELIVSEHLLHLSHPIDHHILILGDFPVGVFPGDLYRLDFVFPPVTIPIRTIPAQHYSVRLIS